MQSRQGNMSDLRNHLVKHKITKFPAAAAANVSTPAASNKEAEPSVYKESFSEVSTTSGN